jgi:hypothetical protein
MSESLSPLNRRKRILFTLIMIALMWLSLEGAIPLMYRILLKKPFPRAQYEKILFEWMTEDEFSTDKPAEREAWDPFDPNVFVIHPYLGFTFNLTGQENAADPFLGWPEDMLTRRDDRLVVAIFGGSFAEGVYANTSETLRTGLEEATGKEVALIYHAMGGYKQPQQLLTLTYLISLGAEFDIVINIDGFNEVALAPFENVPKGVFPMYPRGWFFLLGQVTTREALTRLARLDVLERQEADWAKFIANRQLYRSNVFLFIWWLRHSWMERERASLNLELVELATQAEQQGYEVTGPVVTYANDEALSGAMAAMWKNASEQMKVLSEANGIRYYHFLQPNQYLQGMKPMSAEELEIAVDSDHPYKRGAELGYPFLIQAGEELRAEGINFHDMTMVFASHPESLYVDSCCHPSAAGYQIFTERMLELILSDGIEGE